MSDICIHHDRRATHALWLDRERFEPICEGCADDYDPERVTPLTFYECDICGRQIERDWPEVPLCNPCEQTARAAGRQAAEAMRHE
jgi:hypothetical protein